MLASSDLILETTGALARIRLNRPQAINALTLDMVRGISRALDQFAADPAIGFVLISGEGPRGLCAGGDIRALYDHGRDGSGFGAEFFRDEYRMNAQIASYKKPYIALMDGITMGGGVGISAHGSIRIVTERTRLAMPETGIGFFPDIGASWLLGKAPGELGTLIGLTGDSIGGADAIYAGLADFFVPSSNLPDLIAALAVLPATTKPAAIRAIVKNFTTDAMAPLAVHRAEIDKCFAHPSVEDIIAALTASNSEFAQKTLAVLAQRSPTSLKVTLRMVRAGRAATSLEACLQREYEACTQVLASDEFYEGVRAAVVDKDRAPQWRPATLAEVTPERVNAYFQHRTSSLF